MTKIQELESLVNRTRQEANKANWQYYTALLSAGNRAKEEFHRVWSVVNTSQVVLSKQIRKLHDNLIQEVGSEVARLFPKDSSICFVCRKIYN